MQMASKKWTEQRDMLEAVKKIVQTNPRLDPKSNFGELVSEIQKV